MFYRTQKDSDVDNLLAQNNLKIIIQRNSYKTNVSRLSKMTAKRTE